MTKIFLTILSFSFVLQTSASFFSVEKKETATEQCPDDKKEGEENSKSIEKRDQEQLFYMSDLAIHLLGQTQTIPDIKFHIPSGYIHKILLPPR